MLICNAMFRRCGAALPYANSALSAKYCTSSSNTPSPFATSCLTNASREVAQHTFVPSLSRFKIHSYRHPTFEHFPNKTPTHSDQLNHPGHFTPQQLRCIRHKLTFTKDNHSKYIIRRIDGDTITAQIHVRHPRTHTRTSSFVVPHRMKK